MSIPAGGPERCPRCHSPTPRSVLCTTRSIWLDPRCRVADARVTWIDYSASRSGPRAAPSASPGGSDCGDRSTSALRRDIPAGASSNCADAGRRRRPLDRAMINEPASTTTAACSAARTKSRLLDRPWHASGFRGLRDVGRRHRAAGEPSPRNAPPVRAAIRRNGPAQRRRSRARQPTPRASVPALVDYSAFNDITRTWARFAPARATAPS